MKFNKESERVTRINPLLEALKSSPERVHKIWIQKEKQQRKITEIIQRARARHIPLFFVPKKRLDRLDQNHQGVTAFLAVKKYSSLSSLIIPGKVPFLVLLDGIEDPQNLGAIIRTAEGAGVDGIILPKRRAAGLTEAVSLVSAGAVEHVKIARVKNMVRTMEELREREIWLVGTEGGGQNYWYDFDYTLPVGLVLGSEGKGLRPLVRRKCDKILSLPLLGKMTSLNVASAASIFFYEVVRQRMKKAKNHE